MEEYKSNSHKSRREKIKTEQPEKRVEKVVSGSVKTKKRNGLRKLTNVFIPEDVDNVKSYIFEDIVAPAVKDIILDAVKAVLGTNGKNGRKSTASKVSYRKYYDSAEPRRNNYNSRNSSSICDYDDIFFDTRSEAENVLGAMDEILATYKIVRVADYFDLAGIDGPWTGNDYGWTDLRMAKIIYTRDGYTIKLPNAYALDD